MSRRLLEGATIPLGLNFDICCDRYHSNDVELSEFVGAVAINALGSVGGAAFRAAERTIEAAALEGVVLLGSAKLSACRQ